MPAFSMQRRPSHVHGPLAALLALLTAGPLGAQTGFGSGCPGFTGTTPALSAAGYVPSGLPFSLTLTGRPATASLLLVGSSNQTSAYGPLPFSLVGLDAGLSGCSLLVSAELLIPVTLGANGQAQVPATAWACGVTAHFQHWNLDIDSTLFTNLGGWSSGLSVTPAAAGTLAQAGDLIVTEVMKDPSFVFDAVGEWFEVLNTTAQPINLAGWLLRDDSGEQHRIQAGCGPVNVPAGGYALLGVNSDTQVNGGVSLLYQTSGFFLGNSADQIEIRDPAGTLIDRLAYDTVTFPSQAGRSLALATSALNASANDLGSNWSSSTCFLAGVPFNTDRGTPNLANDQCQTSGPADPTGELCFSEVMQNPSGISDDVGEWFELYNTTNSSINLNGYRLQAGSQSFTVNTNLSIPAKGYRLFLRNGNPSQNGGIDGVALGAFDYPDTWVLNNASETLEVLTPGGSVVSRITYDNGLTYPDPSGASMSLDPSQLTQAGSALGSNWCLGSTPYGGSSQNLGSPGVANPACP